MALRQTAVLQPHGASCLCAGRPADGPVYGEARHLQRNEYQIKIPYRDDADLDKIVGELLYEI
jgi:hypothetical protein